MRCIDTMIEERDERLLGRDSERAAHLDELRELYDEAFEYAYGHLDGSDDNVAAEGNRLFLAFIKDHHVTEDDKDILIDWLRDDDRMDW